MAKRRVPADPFSVLSCIDDIHDSDFSSDDENTGSEENDENITYISKPSINNTGTLVNDLPLPKFEDTKHKPNFLVDKRKHDVDWDTVAKSSIEKAETVHISNTHAIPPPRTYEPVTEKLKPTLGKNSDPKRKMKNDSPGENVTKKTKI